MAHMKQLATELSEMVTKHGVAAVMMAVGELLRWECRKCGHKWQPRGVEVPVSCPRCKSRAWRATDATHN